MRTIQTPRRGLAAAIAAALLLTLAGCAGSSASSGTDPAASAKQLRTTAEGLGGYVLNELVVTEQRNGLYVQPSTVTVAVPSAKLDDALDALGKLGDVTYRAIEAQDVTTEVVDLEARIKTLRASIARVEELMARAGTITQIAQVEAELTSRQSQLESMVAQQRALADRVAMTPVTVTLRTAAIVAEPNPLWQGLEAGLEMLLTSVRVLIVVVGALLPFAVLGLAIALPILWWRRRHARGAKPGSKRTPHGPVAPQPARVTEPSDALAPDAPGNDAPAAKPDDEPKSQAGKAEPEASR